MNKDREIPVRIIVRKKRGHAGHHGGGWKVALADFMTSMFALFLVLWIVNQSSTVKEAVAGYFKDPMGHGKEFGSSVIAGQGVRSASVQRMGTGQAIDLPRQRLRQLGDRITADLLRDSTLSSVAANIEITMTPEGLRIELVEDSGGTFFEAGSAVPSAKGRRVLDVVGRDLVEVPNPLLIEGYTDSRPYQSPERYGNWELSTDRANMARRIVAQAGVPDRRVDLVRGWADRRLKLPDQPNSPRNRRVSITVAFNPFDQRPATDSDSVNP